MNSHFLIPSFLTDAYTTDDLVFHWRTDAKAVEVNSAISLPEYDLKNVSEMVCTQNLSSTGKPRDNFNNNFQQHGQASWQF